MSNPMQSVIELGIEQAPVIGAAIGVAVGSALDKRALDTVEKSHLILADAHDDSSPDAKPVGEKPSLLQRPTAILLALTALTGSMGGQYVKSHETNVKIAPMTVPVTNEQPTILTAIDQNIGVQDNNHFDVINKIAIDMQQSSKHKDLPMIAHNGWWSPAKTADDIKNQVPYGAPTIASATHNAMDFAYLMNTNTNRYSAALAITDGNSVGSPNTVLTHSQRMGDKSPQVPLYIIDTGAVGTKTAKSLAASAKATGGEYWNARDVKNVADVEDVILANIAKHTKAPKNSPKTEAKEKVVENDGEKNRWLVYFLAGALLTGYSYRLLKQETTHTGFDGKKKED